MSKQGKKTLPFKGLRILTFASACPHYVCTVPLSFTRLGTDSEIICPIFCQVLKLMRCFLAFNGVDILSVFVVKIPLQIFGVINPVISYSSIWFVRYIPFQLYTSYRCSDCREIFRRAWNYTIIYIVER